MRSYIGKENAHVLQLPEAIRGGNNPANRPPDGLLQGISDD
jgi:hypothetical protein